MNFRSLRVASMLVAALLLLVNYAIPTAMAADEEEPGQKKIFYELQTIQEDPITYRRSVKQALEGHMAAYGLILTARSSNSDHAKDHADAIANLGRQHKVIYPEGSETDSTREEIWSQPEAFAVRLEHLAAAAAFLKEKDDEGNRHLKLNALIKLGESCESCHQRFRVDSDSPLSEQDCKRGPL